MVLAGTESVVERNVKIRTLSLNRKGDATAKLDPPIAGAPPAFAAEQFGV